MNKQTSVEFLEEQLWFVNRPDLFDQANEMEKEQKIAFANEYSSAVMGGCLLTPSEFYNETFKSE